jgi:hypothetical protein
MFVRNSKVHTESKSSCTALCMCNDLDQFIHDPNFFDALGPSYHMILVLIPFVYSLDHQKERMDKP